MTSAADNLLFPPFLLTLVICYTTYFLLKIKYTELYTEVKKEWPNATDAMMTVISSCVCLKTTDVDYNYKYYHIVS